MPLSLAHDLSAFRGKGCKFRSEVKMQDEKYRAAAVERAMKVQEIVMRAMSKQITLWQAAEILGVSTRTMRRMRQAAKSEASARGGFGERVGSVYREVVRAVEDFDEVALNGNFWGANFLKRWARPGSNR